jgi:hexosaminidase
MNTYHPFISIFIVMLLASACTLQQKSDDDFLIRWKVESNYLENNLFRSELTLINRSDRVLDRDWALYFNLMRLIDTDSVSPEFIVEHINGDFYRVTPSDRFEPLPPGEEISFTFDAYWSAIKEVDAPDGAYIEFEDGSIVRTGKVIVEPFEREEQFNRNPNDLVPVPTPELVFAQNEGLTVLSPEETGLIVPTPVSVIRSEGSFTLTAGTTIHYEPELEREARFLTSSLESLTGRKPPLAEGAVPASGNVIGLSLADVEIEGEPKGPGDEAYALIVDENGIRITGTDPAGVFYGIQSLRSILPIDVWRTRTRSIDIDALSVRDMPVFGYRGLHLDVSRNFQPVEQVKKLLNVMAFYKLNKFHFHLTDDEGWRLAINAFPELTEVGGRRGHTHDESKFLQPTHGSGPDPDPSASMGSGWYTQEEYIEILRYANERHIEVIPEIDVPGHARAALVGMKARYDRLVEEGKTDEADRYRIHDPRDESVYRSIQRWDDNVINVCQESTYRFLSTVFNEIIEMHGKAGAPLTTIHVGGDEVPRGVWERSPACEVFIGQSNAVNSVGDLMDYFFTRMVGMLQERGLAMSAWEEFSLVRNPATGRNEPNPVFTGRSIPYVWSNVWGSGTEAYSYALANAGYKIVMSHASNFYLDFATDKHPQEPGMYWGAFVNTRDPYAFIPFDLYKSGEVTPMGHPIPENAYDRLPRLTEEGMRNILGIQGQLWAELFRTPDRLEYMALPRIIPLAERAWAPQEEWMDIDDRTERHAALAREWNVFANRLGQRELPRLDALNGGYGYRIPPPGALFENGVLQANVSYPGLAIRYTIDGTEPAANSRLYEGSVSLEGNPTIKLRVFDTRGRGSRTVTLNGN